MFISVSLAIFLGAVVFLLWRYANLPAWQAAICALFGYQLALSSIGPAIGSGVRAVVRFIAGVDL